MRVVVGAPVAERDWILPEWFRCLKRQTIKPEKILFVYSESQDNTLQEINSQGWVPIEVFKSVRPFYSRDERNNDSNDPHRADHFAHLRNKLLRMFMRTDADYFVSLDTDVLLQEPSIIEELITTIQNTDYSVVSPVTYLHVLGKQSQCYNAGCFWGGTLSAADMGWRRIEYNEFLVRGSGKLMPIDIPMAVVAMRRHVAGMCQYRVHECGEDIGFAQSLAQKKFKVGWRTDLEVRHVWGPNFLHSEPANV